MAIYLPSLFYNTGMAKGGMMTKLILAKFIMTTLIASGVGYGFHRLRVPAGLLVGSLIGAAVLNIVLGVAWMPTEAKWLAQILAGTFIASSLDGGAMRRMPKLIRPALLIVFGMLVVNVVTGVLVYWLTPLDLITSLMGTVPGGMSDVPLISADLGADLPIVATMQFSRLLVAVGIYPSFIRWWEAKRRSSLRPHGVEPFDPSTASHATSHRQKSTFSKGPVDHLRVLYTLGVAIFAGGIGKDMGIPAGALVFSMMTILSIRFFGIEVSMPKYLKRIAQILSGAYVGSVFGVGDFSEMAYLIGPIAISNTGYLILCVTMGHLLSKRFGMPLSEAMLATTPGGSSDMVLIASEMGVDSREVLVFQMMRLMMVVALFPIIIKIIVDMTGL